MILPIGQREVDADVARDRVEVDRRVGRSADRRVDADRVQESGPRQNVGGLAIRRHHLDDATPGFPRRFLPVAIGRRDRCRTRQRHAQRLGQRVHRRGGAHGVAVAGRRRGARHQLDEAGIVDLSRRQHLARAPHDGARPGALALVPAVEHRPDRQRDRRDVDGRRRHQRRRRRLVTTDGQHHAVERVAVEHLDQRKIGEVAVQPGGRALAGFLKRMGGEFERYAARLGDTGLDALGEDQVVTVAWHQVAARLRDADDRSTALDLLQAQPEVQVALDVERGHVGVGGIVEPGAATQAARRVGRHAHDPAMPCIRFMRSPPPPFFRIASGMFPPRHGCISKKD